MDDKKKLSVLDWADDVIKDYIEFEEIAAAEDPQFERIYDLIAKWNNNFFPKSADRDGIALFEQLLDITPRPNEDLEIRRYRVIAKLNAKLPYTEIQLRRILGGILGYDGFTLTVKDLVLTISLAERNNNKLQIILELLKEIVPMNILIILHQLIMKHMDIYFGGYLKVGNRVRISPRVQESVQKDGIVFYGGYVKVGNRVKISPSRPKEVLNEGTVYSSGYLRIGNTVRINPKINE